MNARIVCGALAASLAAAMLSGCAHGGPGPADSPSATRPTRNPAPAPATAPAQEFTGTLEGGIMAIGGETTGWRLVGEGESGAMDVDVSKVRAEAEGLSGKRVTVTGRIVTKDYVERGPMPVLVAERIVEAPG